VIALALALALASASRFPPEQHCLDVARTYGDPRVIELIKTKMDALPKPKDPRKGKRKEPPAKPRTAAAALKDKVMLG